MTENRHGSHFDSFLNYLIKQIFTEHLLYARPECGPGRPMPPFP